MGLWHLIHFPLKQKWLYTEAHVLLSKLQPPQIPSSLSSVSVRVKPPLHIQLFVLLLIHLIDCKGKANDFLLTTDDALAFNIRHPLQSIRPMEITASIIGRDTQQNNREHRGRHGDWFKLDSVQESQATGPQRPPTKKRAIKWREWGWMDKPACMRTNHFRLEQLNKSSVREQKEETKQYQLSSQSNPQYQETPDNNCIKHTDVNNSMKAFQFVEAEHFQLLPSSTLNCHFKPHLFLSSFFYGKLNLPKQRSAAFSWPIHPLLFTSFFFMSGRYGDLLSLQKVNAGTPSVVRKLSKRAWNWFISSELSEGMVWPTIWIKMHRDGELIINSQEVASAAHRNTLVCHNEAFIENVFSSGNLTESHFFK